MLEPRMVAARIQGPFVVTGRAHGVARIAASSPGGLAMLDIIYFPTAADRVESLPRSKTRRLVPFEVRVVAEKEQTCQSVGFKQDLARYPFPFQLQMLD